MSRVRSHSDGRVLHLVQRPERSSLEDCLSFCAEGDAVILMDTGVLWLCVRGWTDGFPSGVEFACLRADAAAHGVTAEAASSGIEVLDESGLVAWFMDCRHCLSWK